jgi:hypothetical protein
MVLFTVKRYGGGVEGVEGVVAVMRALRIEFYHTISLASYVEVDKRTMISEFQVPTWVCS